MICPNCHEEMDYVGISDGGGPYGSSVCDEYECSWCGWVDEADCIEVGEADVDESDDEWAWEVD